MLFRRTVAAIAALCLQISGAFAADMHVMDPYFRTSGPAAKSGGAYMHLQNMTDVSDRLLGARSDIAKRVEIHTHIDAGDGVMQMRKIQGGVALPAGGQHDFVRGGDHLMFMGLTRSIKDGEEITVTLTFEKAGDMTVTIPVDLTRMPEQGAMDMDMGSGN